MDIPADSKPLTIRKILRTWWPLAASWMLMSMEPISLSAVSARLAEPNINLAAWGGVVFPLSLIIEAPVIMLLAASTALTRDWDSYRRLRNFMHWTGGLLTVLHVLLAFTPLFDLVVVRLMGSPSEIIEPARSGLRIMTVWTWSIAYRRFNQGALIRFGHANAVGIGTIVRLAADLLVLGIGLHLRTIPGIVVASSAVACGVVAEAVYSGLRLRPVLATQIKTAPAQAVPLTWRAFAGFYFPLVLTSLLSLLIQPLGAAALSRMPLALASLAIWPVSSGLVFLLRSPGVAYNEAVLALVDNPGAVAVLKRFNLYLAAATSLLLLLMAGTPFAIFWFRDFSGLQPDLAAVASKALWIALPLPALSVLQSWYQGVLMSARRTQAITESVIVFLLVTGLILAYGVKSSTIPGIYNAWIAFGAGVISQALWLGIRSRRVLARLESGRLIEREGSLPFPPSDV